MLTLYFCLFQLETCEDGCSNHCDVWCSSSIFSNMANMEDYVVCITKLDISKGRWYLLFSIPKISSFLFWTCNRNKSEWFIAVPQKTNLITCDLYIYIFLYLMLYFNFCCIVSRCIYRTVWDLSISYSFFIHHRFICIIKNVLLNNFFIYNYKFCKTVVNKYLSLFLVHSVWQCWWSSN